MKLYSKFYIDADIDLFSYGLYLGYDEITYIPSRDLRIKTMEYVKKLIYRINNIVDFYLIGRKLLSEYPKGDLGYCSLYIGEFNGRKFLGEYKFKKLVEDSYINLESKSSFPNQLIYDYRSGILEDKGSPEEFYERSENYSSLIIPEYLSFKSLWSEYIKSSRKTAKFYYGYLDLLLFFTYKLNF